MQAGEKGRYWGKSLYNPAISEFFFWLKGQIQAMTFMTIFALHPEAIVQGQLL